MNMDGNNNDSNDMIENEDEEQEDNDLDLVFLYWGQATFNRIINKDIDEDEDDELEFSSINLNNMDFDPDELGEDCEECVKDAEVGEAFDLLQDMFDSEEFDDMSNLLVEFSSKDMFLKEMAMLTHLRKVYLKKMLPLKSDKLLFSFPIITLDGQKSRQTITVKFIYIGDFEEGDQGFWNVAREIIEKTHSEEYGHFDITFNENKLLTTKENAQKMFTSAQMFIMKQAFEQTGLTNEYPDLPIDDDDDDDGSGMQIV